MKQQKFVGHFLSGLTLVLAFVMFFPGVWLIGERYLSYSGATNRV